MGFSWKSIILFSLSTCITPIFVNSSIGTSDISLYATVISASLSLCAFSISSKVAEKTQLPCDMSTYSSLLLFKKVRLLYIASAVPLYQPVFSSERKGGNKNNPSVFLSKSHSLPEPRWSINERKLY